MPAAATQTDTSDSFCSHGQDALELVMLLKDIRQSLVHIDSITGEFHEEQREQESIRKREEAFKSVNERVNWFLTFLIVPGAFISTIMSTPIVRFDTNTSSFNLSNIGIGALKLYVVVAVPVVVLTFLTWQTLLLLAKIKERKHLDKEKAYEDKLGQMDTTI